MSRTIRKQTEVHKTHEAGAGTGMVRVGAYAATTSATPAIPLAIPVPPNSCIMIEAKAVGLRDTGAEGFRSTVTHAFRRDGTGNVTAISTATTVTVEDSSGAPTLTIAANTTDQTVDVTITSEASKNFLWDVYAEYRIITTVG